MANFQGSDARAYSKLHHKGRRQNKLVLRMLILLKTHSEILWKNEDIWIVCVFSYQHWNLKFQPWILFHWWHLISSQWMPNSGHCNACDIFLFSGNFGDDEKALKKREGEKKLRKANQCIPTVWLANLLLVGKNCFCSVHFSCKSMAVISVWFIEARGERTWRTLQVEDGLK